MISGLSGSYAAVWESMFLLRCRLLRNVLATFIRTPHGKKHAARFHPSPRKLLTQGTCHWSCEEQDFKSLRLTVAV